MERLNWAVLGLMGLVTALGLSTSSGAGKAKTDEQPVSVAASSSAPACSDCSACQAQKTAAAAETSNSAVAKPDFDTLIALIESTTKATTGNLVPGESCPGNCAATGVCCDKSLPKSETALAAKSEAHPCEGECCLSKKSVGLADGKSSATQGFVICGDGTCKSVTAEAKTLGCPLAKAADALANLTKQYVCEGGECLAKPGVGTLTITAVDPAPAQPEGLLNLQAAADAAKSEPFKGTLTNGAELALTPEEQAKREANRAWLGSIIAVAPPELLEDLKMPEVFRSRYKNSTPNFQPAEVTPHMFKPTLVPPRFVIPAEQEPVIDNSRAAARAEKLAKIEAKLEAPWELEIEKITLEELASAVQQKYGVPVIIDRKALDEAAYDLATPINVAKQPEIEAGEYLNGLLKDLGLTWIIPGSSDRVLITTITGMENTLLKRVYDITDLVDAEEGSENSPSALGQTIVDMISPNTWKSNGGIGDISIWKSGNSISLIAMNAYWEQRELHRLLEELRSKASPKNEHAAAVVKPGPVAVLRRYPLPSMLDVENRLERQQMMAAHRSFLLNALKDIEGFDNTLFDIVEFNERDIILVTKQLPGVHKAISKKLNFITDDVGHGFRVGEMSEK